MESRITERIAAETGIPKLMSALAQDIPPSDLQSLLLSVYRSRAQSVDEAALLAQALRTSLVAPCSVDARLLHQFDRLAFQECAAFEAVDLSPVCPLGAQSVLGGVSQNHVLTTIRNVEVLGDSTPALALECARRRRKQVDRAAGRTVLLASSHRVARLQPFDFAGFTPHFRLFGLVTAGRDGGSHAFEIQHLGDHVSFYLKLFRALNAGGFSLRNPLVEVSDLSITEALLSAAGISRGAVREHVRAHIPGGGERFLRERGVELPAEITDPAGELARLAQEHGFERQLTRLAMIERRAIGPLRAEFPEARFCFNLARLEGLGYYPGLCLRVSPAAPDGVHYPVADGGFTNWTARLLQGRKERLLTSGIGSEFVCRRYRAAG